MFDKKKYDIQFQKDNYDRIALNVPKGEKAKIAEYAKAKGFESLTDYIKALIKSDMSAHNKTIIVENIMQDGNNNSVNIQ